MLINSFQYIHIIRIIIHLIIGYSNTFDNGYVGKQPLACKEYCAEYSSKELQESMDRCTERMLETAFKTPYNQ